MEEKLQQAEESFLNRIKKKLPAEKAEKPLIVGIVGMIGSGRTLLAKTLVENLKGAVLNSANSARYVLKEEFGLGWGRNVYELLLNTTEWLVKNGYITVYDGNQVDKDRREAIKELADRLDIEYYLLKINTLEETAEKYLRGKYKEKPKRTFEDYWPGDDADDIVQNLKDRNKNFFAIEKEEPKLEFFAEIENEGTIEEFKEKAREIAKRMQS